MLEIGMELLSANGGRFEINQLLFADDTALMADSEEKLCRLVSEVGRACERRKFRVNVVSKSKAMRCYRYGNGDRMHVGFGGSVLSILSEFLSNRSQQVMVDGCRSKLVNVLSGVPQGSVLGPLLFLLHTSELFSILENKMIPT